MKRVIRDVFNIVTTIRWLPEEAENQTFVEALILQDAKLLADDETVSGVAHVVADDSSLEAIYYTYLIAYRLLDDES